MLAAYLGFQNTSDLRKFSISWVCLAAEQYFRGAARGLRKIGPFQLLSKAANKDRLARVEEPETAWPYKDTDSDSRKAFQKKWIVAWSLFKMASNVHVYNANTAEENDRRTKSEQAKFVERHASEFEKLNLTFPSETVEFPSPDLGPLKDTNEGELEVFNRCWEVQRYISSGFSGPTGKNALVVPRQSTMELQSTSRTFPLGCKPQAKKYRPALGPSV